MIVDHDGVQKNRLKEEAVFKTWWPLSTESGEITTDHVEFRQGRHCSGLIVLRRIVVFLIVFLMKETSFDTGFLDLHCNENPTYVFLDLFWELLGLSPNFHIHVSDLYIPRIAPHIWLQ
jgi:hypothetical protein